MSEPLADAIRNLPCPDFDDPMLTGLQRVTHKMGCKSGYRAALRAAASLAEAAQPRVPTEPFRIEGKTPWDFCCAWYRVDDIERCIDQSFRNKALLVKDSSVHEPPPADVRSREFAEWMAHQYRLAMNKGIQIGRRGEA